MNLGQLIRSERKARSLTQGQLAEMVGVSTNTISKYERNIIENIGKDKVIALSKLLDIPTIAFIEAIDEKEIQKEQITPREFQYEVKELLDRTIIDEKEKALIEQTLDFICSDKK